MSKLKPNNPYAFPCEKDEPGKGMTLRDYFAAKALEAIIGNKTFYLDQYEAQAELAYNFADAMLKQRQV